MKNLAQRSLLALLVAAFISASPTSSWAAPPSSSMAPTSISAVEAEQLVYAIGEGKLLASSLGVKWNAARSSVAVICCPPNWQVQIFNTKTHCCTSVKLEAFKGFYFNQAAACGGLIISHVPLSQQAKSQYKQWPAVIFTSDPTFEKQQAVHFNKKEIYGWDAINAAVTAIPANQFALPPQAVQVINRLYGLPQQPGLPVTCTVRQAWPSTYRYLTTRRMAQKKTQKSDYLLPQGYTSKSSIAEVTADMTSADANMAELFEKSPAKQ